MTDDRDVLYCPTNKPPNSKWKLSTGYGVSAAVWRAEYPMMTADAMRLSALTSLIRVAHSVLVADLLTALPSQGAAG